MNGEIIGHNEVISLDVVQCTTDPCKLKKGNVTGTVVFTASMYHLLSISKFEVFFIPRE